MNPPLTVQVIKLVHIIIISFYLNLLYSCIYADESYLVDRRWSPKTLLTPLQFKILTLVPVSPQNFPIYRQAFRLLAAP